ncbi:hypothetical protein D9615_000931 [Tricholomella constricta]|uniref:Uncharacterized protein n=1 Tax=Tricholomella constricta TaxID=117010 RepID=A0A8H5M913_9AGAR|nr:hypothetical protein D9615_000931 [Tricholomella constricta]
MTWDKLPGYEELLQFEAIDSLLNDPSDAALHELGCSEAFAKLPEYLHEWRQLQLQRLLAQLSDAKATGLTDPTTSMHKLYLATSVFKCAARSCGTKDAGLFGYDDFSAHASCPTLARCGPHELVFSTPGSVIAGALVSFLGLDPTTALLCAECPQQSHRGLKGHKIYTWREYVTHAIAMILNKQHLTQSWHLLTSDTTALVRLHESKHPNPMDESWSCNHCAAHFYDFVSRPAAMKHVKEVHSIFVPREGDDVIYYRGTFVDERGPRKPVILVESPLAEFRCARCPDMGTRLYSTRPLEQHLLDKHKVSTPAIGRDFVKVQLIQRSSTTIDSAARQVQ